MDAASATFVVFPDDSVMERLQALVNVDDVQGLYQIVINEELTTLNKIFIVQDVLKHRSDVMRTVVEELERKGLLDLGKLEKEAAKELPSQYMRFFTSEELEGLTSEQRAAILEQLASDRKAFREVFWFLSTETRHRLMALFQELETGDTVEYLERLEEEATRELSPRYMRFFTLEQLKGLTSEQRAVILEQLASDRKAFREVFGRLSTETRRRLLALFQELETDDTIEYLEWLEEKAVRQVPSQYMRFFTLEPLRGLTPEQLKNLTSEQRAVILEQLASDRDIFKEVLGRLSTETRRRLLALFEELEMSDTIE